MTEKRVIPPTSIKSAGGVCGEVGRVLKGHAEAFAVDAAPTARCFGLVEGASRQLDEHYGDFYTELNDYVGDLHKKLAAAGEALTRISRNQERTEDHTWAEAARLDGSAW
ncbi:hypothetical protein [Nonomuraea sp. NPDC050691]|uniref:hypothetical protein n=1 Tax=Nonomuraea sp. NPDC050691 TaxID=3155661 RepID=UPI0033CEE8CD